MGQAEFRKKQLRIALATFIGMDQLSFSAALRVIPATKGVSATALIKAE